KGIGFYEKHSDKSCRNNCEYNGINPFNHFCLFSYGRIFLFPESAVYFLGDINVRYYRKNDGPPVVCEPNNQNKIKYADYNKFAPVAGQYSACHYVGIKFLTCRS